MCVTSTDQTRLHQGSHRTNTRDFFLSLSWNLIFNLPPVYSKTVSQQPPKQSGQKQSFHCGIQGWRAYSAAPVKGGSLLLMKATCLQRFQLGAVWLRRMEAPAAWTREPALKALRSSWSPREQRQTMSGLVQSCCAQGGRRRPLSIEDMGQNGRKVKLVKLKNTSKKQTDSRTLRWQFHLGSVFSCYSPLFLWGPVPSTLSPRPLPPDHQLWLKQLGYVWPTLTTLSWLLR